MNISEFCIRRPVFTILLMASLLVAGVMGYRSLVVSALPRVDFPTISVTAQLPGANPDSMAKNVATILEKQFSTIAGISSMTSTSTTGNSNIIIQFDLDRNIDGAALDVQTAISTALRRLPKEMTTPPSFQKVNPSEQPILFLSVYSKDLNIAQLTTMADDYIIPKVATINGVAQVQIFGAQRPAVRIQFDPIAMRSYNISYIQIANAVNNAISDAPLGAINGDRLTYILDLDDTLKSVDDFKNIVIAWRGTQPIKLGQVAQIKDSVDNTRAISFRDGIPAINLAISRQPTANTIEVVQDIRNLIPQLSKILPKGVEVTANFDRSQAVKDSVHDVQLTLLFTIILVVLVIYAFLTNWRATLIPAIAVPLSIIATAAGMALMDFSINNISLMAITLCVGLVVDDAIVVMENIIAHIERGESVWNASIKGSAQIQFTIISITLSLVAVFLPILLMGGVVGRFFKEFAITISMALLISGLISLTLTPMMCAKILRTKDIHPDNTNLSKFNLAKILNRLYDSMAGGYGRSLGWVMGHKFIVLMAFFASLAGSVALYIYTPKGFIPTEDTGFIFAFAEGTQDASFTNIVEKQLRLAEILKQNPAVSNLNYSTSGGTSRFFMTLKPKGQRPPIQAVIGQLRKATSQVEGIKLFLNPIQNLNIGGRFSRTLYQWTLLSPNQDELAQFHDKLLENLQKNPLFQDVNSDLSSKNLTALITLNDDALSRRNINLGDARGAIYASFGGFSLNNFRAPGGDKAIILEIDPALTLNADAITSTPITIAVNGVNQTISLGDIASVSRSLTPSSINHQGQLPATTISYNLAPGTSLGQAQDILEKLNQTLQKPESITTLAAGTAGVFKDSSAGLIITLILAILVIYIILGMLYESFIHPITILSGIPSAGLGALIFLNLFGFELSLIAMIGIILLIGLVKKNAIMMIDFALTAKKDETITAEQAIIQACISRFRPIMMTTMAAFFGTLPIAIGVGAGAELRQPLGIAVVGGLVISQILTLFITPVVFVYMDKITKKYKYSKNTK